MVEAGTPTDFYLVEAGTPTDFYNYNYWPGEWHCRDFSMGLCCSEWGLGGSGWGQVGEGVTHTD